MNSAFVVRKIAMAVSVPIEDQTKIKVVYNTPENYNAQYINGLIGGLNPRGDIVLNFFYEHSGIPVTEIDELQADGSMKRTLPPQEMAVVRRDVKVGIIIAPHIAANIMGFLKELLDTIAKNQAGTGGEVKNEAEIEEVGKDA